MDDDDEEDDDDDDDEYEFVFVNSCGQLADQRLA